jgi:hypothetical protein
MSKVLSVVIEEFKEAIPATLFFLVVFHIVAWTRMLMLDSYGITLGHSSLATIGALIVAKAILIADKLHMANWFAHRPLVLSILWKALFFSIFTWLFRGVEEFIPLISKYESIRVAFQHLLEEVVWTHFFALNILVFISLLIYCSAVELVRVLGKEKVIAIFFSNPEGKI